MSSTLRPFRVLLACLVGAGLQLCCCNTLAVIQAASRVTLDVGGDPSAHAGCCGNHTQDSQQRTPADHCPDQDHGCLCHLLKHASGLTGGDISSAAPVFFGLVIDAPATAALTTRFVEPLSEAPAIRDQSLVRQHCALIR